MLRRWTLLATLICTPALAEEVHSPSPTTEAVFSDHSQGVRVVPGDTIKGEVVGVIDAPLDQVLAVILDCNGTHEWFPQTQHTESAGRDGSADLCNGSIWAPWPVSDRTWQMAVTTHLEPDGTWVVPFEYVPGSGNIDALFGSYHLKAHGDRTVVAYEGWLDLGLWLPECVLEWGTQMILGSLLGALEEEVQGRGRRVAHAPSAPSL